jgi:hypothetical protein
MEFKISILTSQKTPRLHCESQPVDDVALFGAVQQLIHRDNGLYGRVLEVGCLQSTDGSSSFGDQSV